MLSFSKSVLCLLLASPLIAAVIATGCSDTPSTANSGGGATTQSSSGNAGSGNGSVGGAGGAGGAAGASGSVSGSTSSGFGGNGADGGFVTATCEGKTYECGDTIDNDMDGLTDWQDPDCLGPCDNSESGLSLNIPGGDGPACTVDCYWDGNSGSGDDGCHWNHECDVLSPEGAACPYDPNANTSGTGLSCDELLNQQPASCLKVCPQLVPNGCDCFGCCVLYKGGIAYGPVWLGTEDASGYTCTLAALGMPQPVQDAACAPCTQVKNECYNGCGKCELCIGKTVDDLPPECFGQPPPPDGGPPPPDGGMPPDGGPPPPPQCPTGVQPCGLPGQPLCDIGSSCITGCCVQNPK